LICQAKNIPNISEGEGVLSITLLLSSSVRIFHRSVRRHQCESLAWCHARHTPQQSSEADAAAAADVIAAGACDWPRPRCCCCCCCRHATVLSRLRMIAGS